MNLTYEAGKTRLERWRKGWAWGPFVTYIGLGRLADGRWYAERHGRGASRRDLREGACVYGAGPRGEHHARATIRRWMRTLGGEWAAERE